MTIETSTLVILGIAVAGLVLGIVNFVLWIVRSSQQLHHFYNPLHGSPLKSEHISVEDNLKRLIIAFLSPRYPSSYTEATIMQRINSSQMLDRRCTVDDVVDALRALNKMGLVDIQINPMDNSSVWQITQEGAKKWVLDGKVSICP